MALWTSYVKGHRLKIIGKLDDLRFVWFRELSRIHRLLYQSFLAILDQDSGPLFRGHSLKCFIRFQKNIVNPHSSGNLRDFSRATNLTHVYHLHGAKVQIATIQRGAGRPGFGSALFVATKYVEVFVSKVVV